MSIISSYFKKALVTAGHLMGRKSFAIDGSATFKDLFLIFSNKFISLVRFQATRPWLQKSGNINFFEKNIFISSARKLKIGSGCYFGRNITIDALSKNGISIGNNVSIRESTIINCTGVLSDFGEGLVIENDVGISERCFIQVRGEVRICTGVIIGPNVSIFSENHIFNDRSKDIRLQGVERKGVTLRNGCWIGAGAIILDGVIVGCNSVVAAGSVVSRDVPDFAVVGGVPAKILKNRKGE
jgi:acetyltransferase-like isoleucine patch superfamily enzyme